MFDDEGIDNPPWSISVIGKELGKNIMRLLKR